MKFCFDPSDGDMVLLDGEGQEVEWPMACVTMEDIFEVIMEHATSLCLDDESDRVRLIAMLAHRAEFCEDIAEDIDTDPYDGYDEDLDLPDLSHEVDHLTDGEWRVKDIDEEI